jgi:hypothetical protein
MGTQGEQMERQARQMRARISKTMQALRDRMTPGQVVDQVADYAQHGPMAEFFRNLGREVRENPLPLTLIAVGVAWLITASSLSSRVRSRAAGLDRPLFDVSPDQYATNEPVSRFDRPDRIAPVIAAPDDEEKPRAARFGSERAMEQAHDP